MNKIEGELISALLDGEIEPESHRNTVSRLIDAGPEALETYGRYRLIGDLMRDETAQVVPVADEVHAALRDEPTVLVPEPPSPLRWLRPVGGVALAASVAAAAVFVAPQLLPALAPGQQVVEVIPERPHEATAPQLVAAQSSPTAPIRADRHPGATTAPRWRALNSDLETRLNRLVIEHHEFAGRTGVTGPVPHISVVSYDPR
jgi:negative regulator of sigma E activity